MEKIKHELFENRPKIDKPYPSDIVKRRELLLLAQVCLGNVSDTKSRKDRQNKRFKSNIYNKIMNIYYNWNLNEQELSKI